ncbi:MAG: PKD domain-containing protein [Prolixibacteraceae bacterium]
MKTLIVIWGILMFFTNLVNAGDQVNPCHYSTEGTDFWFGMMQNRSKLTNHYLEVTVTSRTGSEFTLTYGPNEILIGEYTVDANSSIPVSIDFNILESLGSETIEEKGIHLVSTNPVNVYALNYRTQSADVALIYPTESLGNEYFAMCYTPHINGTNETNSEFLVVATEDNTQVQITPSVATELGKPAKVPYKVLLNKGQSYQVQSMNKQVFGQGDLTGSRIVADKPVAFFSGAKATSVPETGNSYDHLFEQIPPTITWGREFYVVPLQSKTKDNYRILAAEDGTNVRIEGLNQTIFLNRGEWKEFEMTSSQASRIIATKKILVSQYCRTQGADGGSGVGDPFMIILSPVVQMINDVTFDAYESNLIRNIFFVNVIAKSTEIEHILMDGSGISSEFTYFPDGKYAYAQIATSSGPHRLQNTNEKEGFLAFIYGFGNSGSTESYGYAVGFNLDIQLDLGLNYVSNDTLILCQGTAIRLEAGTYFEKYQWNTGDTTSYIDAFEEGEYTVTATTGRGCQLSDTIYIKLNAPEIKLRNDTSWCGPGNVLLDAGGGFEKYMWQDGSDKQTFSANQTGDYIVTGTNVFGCLASDTVHVDVFQVPEVRIIGDSLLCGIMNSNLNVEIGQADSLLWNYSGAAKWTSIPSGITFSHAKPDAVELRADHFGKYLINYELTTINGCTATANFQVGFHDIPESFFTVETPESTVKCSSYERIVKYTGKNNSSAHFYWDFGGLMVLDTLAPNRFKVSIGANNRSRTLKLVVEENGCLSPETSVTIGVDPKFSYWADQVQGCDSLCVSFFSQIDIQDSVSYHWTFGDGAVSKLQNPVHCYRDTGRYDVSLLVVNLIDGCRNGSVEPEMIKIYPTPKPVVNAFPELCYGDTAVFEYQGAKEISNCTWLVSGNELISDENTRATYLLKDEISQIGFLVEENKCVSDTLKIEIKRKPHFDFEAPETGICQPFPVELTAIPKDANLQFSWTLDSLNQNLGETISHLFQYSGNYSVTLEAFSNLTGCSSILTKEQYIRVHPLPGPAFSQNYKIATLDHPEITFSNESYSAVSYVWDFGDGFTSEEISPKHTFSEVGEYSVLLKAFSEFGCVDTISTRIKIVPFSFYVPNAFRPDSDIPENKVFIPIREGVDPENYSFEVFNRLGSVVFETKNPENGWSGQSSNGKMAESGIYVWLVKFSDVQGYPHSQKGTVMLVR